MKKIFLIKIHFIFFILILKNIVLADSIILPGLNDYIYNSLPFGSYNTDIHYQQVFDVSLFSGPMTIEGIKYKPNLFNTTDSTALYGADITINVGYTNIEPGFLDPDILDNNTPLNLTTVFSDSAFITEIEEFNYSLYFDFTKDFLFDTTIGYNLILDIVIPNQTINGNPITVGGPNFGVVRASDGQTSARAYSYTDYNGEIQNGGNTTSALKTMFIYTEAPSTPVPEPTSMALFCIGLLGIAGIGRKKI